MTTTTPQQQVHLISKTNLRTHHIAPLPSPTVHSITSSQILVRPHKLALTANNLTYAHLGTALSWWDTYPIPSSRAAQYPASEYGILPAWGIAIATSSTNPELPNGAVLWGFFPWSLHTVPLNLRPAGVSGHWIEQSTHREPLGNIYNRYYTIPTSEIDKYDANTIAARCCWNAGFVLTHYIFAPQDATVAGGQKIDPIHPMGNVAKEMGLPAWTSRDADLQGAGVVVLGAAGRTARGFLWNFLRDRKMEEGVRVALVSSDPGWVKSDGLEGEFVRGFGYDELVDDGLMKWLEEQAVRKVVVIDFGAPAEKADGFIERVKEKWSGERFLAVGVGAEASAELRDWGAQQAKNAALGKIQMNTTWVWDVAREVGGDEAYFTRCEDAFWRCKMDAGFGDSSVIVRKDGEGVKAAWEALLNGRLRKNEFSLLEV